MLAIVSKFSTIKDFQPQPEGTTVRVSRSITERYINYLMLYSTRNLKRRWEEFSPKENTRFKVQGTNFCSLFIPELVS